MVDTMLSEIVSHDNVDSKGKLCFANENSNIKNVTVPPSSTNYIQ